MTQGRGRGGRYTSNDDVTAAAGSATRCRQAVNMSWEETLMPLSLRHIWVADGIVWVSQQNIQFWRYNNGLYQPALRDSQLQQFAVTRLLRPPLGRGPP